MPTEATQVAAWGPRSPLLATRACTSSCRGPRGGAGSTSSPAHQIGDPGQVAGPF